MEKRVRLDIDEIEEDTYDQILFEFQKKFGKEFTFDDWEITEVKNEKNNLKFY